jgi:hypothetical protein
MKYTVKNVECVHVQPDMDSWTPLHAAAANGLAAVAQ